jgi:hypothetical protein
MKEKREKIEKLFQTEVYRGDKRESDVYTFI